MKKTFRKALACLLAVLMVAFSVPFSALAYSTTVGEANYKWWDDSNLPTETPEYESVNATWAFNRNIAKALLTNNTNAPKRWNARPVVGATVSDLGTADDSLEDLWAKYTGYYGKAGFTDAEAAGLILNPTEIKAGQRIAITYEFGGCDMMNNGQILSEYDPAFLAPAGYQDEYFLEDEWDAWDVDFTADYGKVAIENAAFAPVATMDDTLANVGFVAKVATSTPTSSVFIGGYSDMDAKYGIPVATFFFEAKQDCDLTQVITFKDGQGGTRIAWGNMDAGFKDELYLMTMTETPYTAVLFAPPIWTNATSAPTPETHEHHYVETSRTPATCTEDGKIVYTCDSTVGTCDAPTKEEAITAPGHTPVSADKEATCTEDGVTGATKCSVCGTPLEAGTVIPALQHNYTSQVTKAPTCTEEGVETFTCTRCDDTYTKSIAATGHDVQVVPGKAATCTETGLTDGKACTKCDYVEVAQETIPALGHDFSVVLESTAADCQTKGTTKMGCSRCDAFEIVEGGYGPHKEVAIPAVEATCETAGSTAGVKCELCDTVITAPETIPALGHDWDEGTVTQAPTCTEDGVKTFECSRCDKTKTETVAATGHTEVEIPAVDATCTTAGSTAGVKCSVCNTVLTEPTEIPALGHVEKTTVTTVDATFDAPGSVTTVITCERCGETLKTTAEEIPVLKSYTVTVDATDMGTVTLDGKDVSEGAAVKVAPESKVTLTATPVEGAAFVGWTANGVTLVSTDAEFTTTVLANVTYTPVFEVEEAESFTVTFVDAYGNIVSVQNSADGITVPAAPARPGYAAATENGWSMTNDEIAALTSNATITAQYVKAEDVLYTVNAEGCDITANGETVKDTVSVPFDTKVTVTNTSATAWVVKDAVSGEEVTVAYGDSYTFFVTADITLTIATDAVAATPTVANVGVSTTGNAGAVKAVFKATRTMADGCQFIDAGFVYGKGDLGAITLDDVDGKAVKAVYTKTASEQFSLTYGLSAQQGTMTAVAFLAYVDADGNNQVIYADPMTYTY